MDVKALKLLCNNFSLLYVEDDKDIAAVFLSYLEKLFTDITYRKNGKEGLLAYKEKKFDLIITDIQMPLMTGLEMASEIKEIDIEQNILIISAYSDSEKLFDAIKLNIDGYILKPVDYKHLNAVLFKVLSKMQKIKERYIYKSSLELLVDKKVSENLLLQHDKIQNYDQTLYALIEIIESRDSYTGKHSLRVAGYSKMIAKHMKLSDDKCEEIYKAGMLHDLGKIGIPDSLLLKPGKLSDDEFNLIKQHVNIGFHMLNQIPMFTNIARIINAHHEKLDGSGYPNGIKGNEIPLSGMILALCDAFDAITTSRVYKNRKTVVEALTELKSLSDIHFRKDVVESATEILKDVIIDKTINQLPHNTLEEERFSFFYKDALSNLFNETYLNFVLAKNMYEIKFTKLHMLYLNNFGEYNKENGWSKGNELISNIALKLKSLYSNTMIFRVHGDDFIILSKDNCFDTINFLELQKIVDNTIIVISKKDFNITKNGIDSLSKLETLI